jgi:hypothetical protein
LAEGGPSGYFLDDDRYVGNDFQPRAGSITFDTGVNWFFDGSPETSNDIPIGRFDFFTTAVHEIGHALAFSEDINAYKRWISGGNFVGPKAMAMNGGQAVPLEVGSLAHIRDGYEVGGFGELAMDPSSLAGSRQLPTKLDVAFLEDVGYRVNYDATFVNPRG